MSKIHQAFQRFCSIALSVTTTLWLSGLTLLLPVSPVLAVTPDQYGLKEGDLIRAPSLAAPEGWKVYIINQAGYKRHIFNPDVFKIYGHLKWSNVKDVSADTVNAFTTSDLYRVDGGDGKVYTVDANGVKHHVNVTAADFVTKGYKWDQVYVINSAEGNYYTVGSEVTTGPGVTPPVTPPAAGAVSVSVSPSTPAGTVLAAGTVFNTVTTLRFTAGSQAASITGLTVTKDGLIANNLISGVSVWQGSARQGNILTSLTSDGKATFSFGTAIAVPANSTVDLDIKANLSASATSGTFALKVGKASDISLSGGATVSGTFPVMGNGFNVVSSGALGSYTITAQAVGGNTASTGSGNLEIGTSQKEVAKMQFNETTGREDMLISQITLYIEGSAQEKDLTNWKLKGPDGTLLAENPSKVWPYVTFTLGTAYRIPEGVTRTLSVLVDPVDGADRFMRVHIQNDYDVILKGNETGAFIAPASFTDQASSDGYWRLKQGSLTVSLTSGSPSGNIAVGAQEAVLAKFDLRAVGEQLEIRKMDLEFVEASSSTAQLLTGNVKVQSDDGSVTYLSLAADTANLQRTSDTMESTRFDLNTYIVIPSGTTKTIKVIGTVKTTATSAQTYKAKIGNFFTWRASTKDFTDLLTSTAGTSANTLTVQTSALTVAKNSSVADKNVAKGANNVVLGSFVLQAGAAEGINVSAITITYGGTGTASNDITNVSVSAGGTAFGTTVGTPSTSDSFTGTLAIAKSSTVAVEVKGNVKTSVTTDQTAIIQISSLSATGQTTSNTITAADTGGTAVSSSNKVSGQTVTYKAGSLTITKEGAPTTNVLTAGASNVTLDRVKFQALNDTLTLQKVRFRTSLSGSSTAGGGKYIKKAYLYNGDTNLTPNGIVPVPNGASSEALFDGLSVTITPGTATFLILKADLSDASVITAASDAGSTFAVQIKSDGTTDDLQVVGTQGNLGAADINTSSTDSDIAASDNFLFHRTIPMISGTPSGAPSGTQTPQANQEVFRFNIKSETAGTSLRVGQIKVRVSISPVNGWNLGTIGTWDLWEGDTSPSVRIAQNTSLTLSSSTTSGTLTFDRTNQISSLFDEGATSAEITAGTNGRLISDAGKTYFLKVDTSSIRTSSSATPGNATLSFKIDGVTGYTTATGTSTDPYDSSAVATSSEDNWGGGGVFYAYQMTTDLSYIGGTNAATGFNASDFYPANSNTLTY